jgi:phosphohistidine phosphatase
MTDAKPPVAEADEPLDAATEEALSASVSEAVKSDADQAATPSAPQPEAASADPTPEPPAAPGTLTLYLLRHADAGDPMAWTADDAERPLSKKGRRQAKRLARHLKDLDVQPAAILTSPKIRASATAKIVGRGVSRKPRVDERLTIGFGSDALTALVSGLEPGTDSVMLVGHDPDFSDAASWLVGTTIQMRKGALAVIDLPEREAGAGRGSLRWLLPPDAVAG